jgi:peptidoglycan hydrolase CwlO-like protein
MNKNLFLAVFLMGMLVGTPQFVFANDKTQDPVSEWKLETQGWSIQDHMVAAKAEEEKVQSLETRIQHLDKRIAHLDKKPHFDPKGIHRNSLKLISSTLKGKTDLLNEKIAWHSRQADLAKLTE